MKTYMRAVAAGLCVLMGATGAANADFNVYSASRSQNDADLVQVRGINPGAAFAIGTMGVIAGAAIASSARPRYCDPYYEYCGPRRVYRDEYGRTYYKNPPRRYDRPDHYPVDLY
jgi:hypothetical protein